ncbi:MAG: aminodeoxychorismate/anthranilate synthase component II [Ignavibacteriales bacterium]|nr:aminodeoxychorismate/anthranilate synthase component II [Ignavibacteriales bacterium]
MKILIVDNYDSFTYNLVQLLNIFVDDIIIKKNDEIYLDEARKIKPDKILISPGPGRPEYSNITLDCIKTLGIKIPILGVCLGHQAIGYCFGAKIVKASVLMHGKMSNIIHDKKTIFNNIPQNFAGGRYHSLIIERESIPDVFEISAYTSDGIIMGIRHKQFPIEGIQFHPESILTIEGEKIIKNWLEL